MIHQSKPWVDVGTMCVARLSLKDCLGSCLDQMEDRQNYNLRWLFHLDQYGLPGLEGNWAQQLKDAIELSERFDDCVLMAHRSHQGYGGSFWHILREVQNPFFYLDDDLYWKQPFMLEPAFASKVDYYTFNNSKLGGTSPACWSLGLIQYLLKVYPTNRREMTEKDIIHLLRGQDFTRDTRIAKPDSGRLYRNCGWHAFDRFKVRRYGPARAFVNESGEPQRKH